MLRTCLTLIVALAITATPVWAAPILSSLPSLSPVVEKAEPAVVNISAEKVVEGRQFMGSPFGNNEIFEKFFGPNNRSDRQQDRKTKSLGSGFIIDSEGLIITNNHVVEGAENIRVKLSNGQEIEAEIIGRDPKTDLALIKLKKKGTYPHLTLGDSSKIKIGDWVLAIGNPFGLDHTVTAGILSARSRAIGAGPYDDFLQTDASINPGNSGGPLLNLAGEVIGINTAIVSGASGIGFAIPANLAKGVVSQLESKGRVVRGWMGVIIQKVTPELAKSYGLDKPEGALVGDIDPSGPALDAELKRGDIILEFDGQNVTDWQDLPLIVANTDIGKKVELVVFRDNKKRTLKLTVAELKESPADSSLPGSTNVGNLGLTFRELTPEIATRLKLSQQNGLYISDIAPDSPAVESGLEKGDVIVEIDNKEVKTLGEYRKALADKKEGDIVRFLVKRNANTMFYTVTVPD